MTKLENRIRTNLQAAATHLPDTTDDTVQLAEPTRPPRVLGPVVAVAAMVVVLVVVGGSLLWLANLGGPDTRRLADTVAAPVLERFPIPSYIPESAELVYGDYAVPDPDSPTSITAVVAHTTTAGFTDAVVVTVYDTSQVGIGIPEGEPVVINGRQAVLFRNKGRVTVWWQQQRRVVSVQSPTGDAALTKSFAEVVTVTDTAQLDKAALSFGSLPDGLAVFAPPQTASLEPYPYVQIQRPLGPEVSDPGIASIAVLPATLQQTAGSFGSATTDSIGGIDAYRFETEDGAGFAWSLTPELTVTVGGNLPIDELRAIAEGLNFVSETEWRRHYDNTGPQIPTTTIVEGTPTTEAPAVATDSEGPEAPTTTLPEP